MYNDVCMFRWFLSSALGGVVILEKCDMTQMSALLQLLIGNYL
jgi:hypothetical protein